MDYRTLETLRRAHPGWRLLAAAHAPLIVGFLYRSFVQPNVRTLGEQELVAKLSDYLYSLRERSGEDAFPKPADQYLQDWAADDHGWLRKYYVPANDEPHYDITPAAERAIRWLESLEQPEFVGTESRLLTIFALLREITEKTQLDPAARIAELERRQAQISAEIERICDGQIPVMDPTQVKERFLQLASTARALLSDFRQVEQNFRTLDRSVRERVAIWEGGKGALIDDVLGQRDAITDSDQGKSFRAFWDFLMSPARQEELSSLLEAVFALDPIKGLAPDRRLLRIHYDWLEAGEVAQRTVARLSEQLRRYLDDQAWLENRRIMQLIRDIEQHALAVRSEPPSAAAFMELDEPAPVVNLAMDRPLFSPPFKPKLAVGAVSEGDEEIAADSLFEQVHVDKARLAAEIRRALQARDQISLADLVEASPLEHGLAELLAYMSLAAESRSAVIDDGSKQTVSWTDTAGIKRRATMPLVIFSRRAKPRVESEGT